MGETLDTSELTVYLSGMVFFDGCKTEQKQALLPNGSDQHHFASLWFRNAHVQSFALPSNIQSVSHRQPGNQNPLVETVIHGPVGTIVFPDQNDSPAVFENLEHGLGKLKKKGTGEPFPVDPQHADTIAVVPIHGGRLTATHAGKDRLVVWRIRKWTTVRVTVGAGAYVFTFANGVQPELFLSNACADSAPGGDHYQIYKRLNVNEHSDIEKPEHAGEPVELSDFARDVLKVLRERIRGAGETPTCCR